MLPAASHAGPIAAGPFYEFGFLGASFATGCDPADPGGQFCTPSSGTPTSFLDAPPWTFTAPFGGLALTVTDVFQAGDRFDVYDFGALIGSTSTPTGSADCGDDPVPCLADPNISKRLFNLAAGNHSITIYASSADSGVGYLRAAAIPEPSSFLSLCIGALGLLWAMRRRFLG